MHTQHYTDPVLLISTITGSIVTILGTFFAGMAMLRSGRAHREARRAANIAATVATRQANGPASL